MDRVHADRLAVPGTGSLETHAGNEYVMPHAPASREDEEESPTDPPRDPSQSAIGGVQKTLTVDPPLDQGIPLHQVCLSLPAVLFCARVYAYIL